MSEDQKTAQSNLDFLVKLNQSKNVILHYLRQNDTQKQYMNGSIIERELCFGNEVSGG